MKRFQRLVKNKIHGRLSEGKAKELQLLVKEQEDFRQSYQLLFPAQPAKRSTVAEAEQAFAAHYAQLLRAKGGTSTTRTVYSDLP